MAEDNPLRAKPVDLASNYRPIGLRTVSAALSIRAQAKPGAAPASNTTGVPTK